MRRILFSGVVAAAFLAPLSAGMAADAPTAVKTAPAAERVFDWTGFYGGVHAGRTWSEPDWLLAINNPAACAGITCPGPAGGHHSRSWLAGAQLGLNRQIGPWLLGAEVQVSAVDLDGSVPAAQAPTITLHTKTDWVGTLAARIGAASERVLFYGKAGGAWARDTYWTSTLLIPVAQRTADNRFGWMLGVGVEYAATQNWSIKIEYDYLHFGRRTETLHAVNAAGPFDYDIKQTIQLVKVGLNYRFGSY